MRTLARTGRTAAALGAATLVLTGFAVTTGSATASPTGKVPVPASGLYFGAANNASGGGSLATAFTGLESKTGHHLGIHRSYQQWNGPTISSTVQWDVANGKLPAISIKPNVRWAAIANGSVDADIRAQAAAFKSFGHPVLLSLHHEPENDTPAMGTPADYVAAWRHYVSVFRQQGVSNVSFAWIMMAYSFANGGAKAAPYYPGDDVIDWIAADGYNWAGCRAGDKYISFAQVFSGFKSWAAPHNKPLFIAEVGTEEQAGNPMGKAQWIRDMLSNAKAWPQLKAISWFNTSLSPSSCKFLVDTSANSLAAWRSVAADPYANPNTTVTETGAPPVVVTGMPFNITGSSAGVFGSIDPNGLPSTVTFQYGTTTAYGSSVSVPSASGDGVQSIQAALPNLQPGTTYHYRVVANNSAGGANGLDRTFTTTAAPAAVVTGMAFDVSGTSAGVFGSIDPNGLPTLVSFQYGTSTAYGSSVPIAAQGGDGVRSIQASLPNLQPGTVYHYRVVAANAAGVVYGGDRVLTTGAAPKGWTWWADGVRSTGATLHAGVLSSASASMSFQYGTSTAYGLTSVSSPVAASSVTSKTLTRVNNLRPNTTYHYRVAVRSNGATVYGLDRVMRTTR